MEKVISKDGTAIAYDRRGEGQPIILVDGALCSRAFGPMPKLASLLSKNFSVINYDRRGRNESGDSKSYHIDKEIEDINALIQVAGGSSFLVGISSGAALSLAAAAQGLPISKMALYEPPFMVDDEGHHPPIDSEQQLQLLIAADRRGDAVKFFLKDMVAVPAIFVFMIQLLPIWSKLKAVAHTLPYDASVMGDFSLPSKYASLVSVSTLVMGGQKSPAPMRHAVEALAKILPNSDLQMLKGQTHNVSEKILAPVLANFFA